MSNSERDYLRKRAAQERTLAANAPDNVVRDIHLELAREYERRAETGSIARKADNAVFGITSVSTVPEI